MKFELKDLSTSQSIHFNEFLLKQLELTQRREITSLYRGDNLENLFKKLNVHYLPNNLYYDQLVDKLFMVGEKGKHFYADHLFSSSRRVEIKIDDCSERVFNHIFDNLNASIKNKNRNNQLFFDNNSSFKAFFLDKRNNKKKFTGAALSSNTKEKLFFRNYYLTLLHQLAAINYRDSSHLVSTSTNSKVAGIFGGTTRSIKKARLHIWTPNVNLRARFERYGLPKYKGKPYRYQHEVSILAGILPHYISGLEIVDEKKFFVNPSIFTNPITKNLFIEGLDINQDRFEEMRLTTNYRSSFMVSGENIYENS